MVKFQSQGTCSVLLSTGEAVQPRSGHAETKLLFKSAPASKIGLKLRRGNTAGSCNFMKPSEKHALPAPCVAAITAVNILPATLLGDKQGNPVQILFPQLSQPNRSGVAALAHVAQREIVGQKNLEAAGKQKSAKHIDQEADQKQSESKHAKKHDPWNSVKLLLSGATSALVSRTCVAPLERVKMELVSTCCMLTLLTCCVDTLQPSCCICPNHVAALYVQTAHYTMGGALLQCMYAACQYCDAFLVLTEIPMCT